MIIQHMNEFDWSDLDVRALKQLVAVVETGSITGAAHSLGITQSAVSHQLDKLRAITGDVLFVKSGRGIVATARAQALAEQARDLLRQLQGFAHSGAFDPARWQATVTIAANDLQRDVLLPPLLARLRTQAPGVTLRVLSSNVPSVDMLRSGQCDLVISPRPPEGGDIVQKRLFEDQYRVFYDPAQRDAPRNLADYLGSDHITVFYGTSRSLNIDSLLSKQGFSRRFVVTAPSLLGQHLLRELASVPPPLPTPPMAMYLIWHLRHQHDEAHQWLRGLVGG